MYYNCDNKDTKRATTNKEASKQTNKQTSNQANKQARRQTSKQANKQTSSQANKPRKQAIKQTNKQTNNTTAAPTRRKQQKTKKHTHTKTTNKKTREAASPPSPSSRMRSSGTALRPMPPKVTKKNLPFFLLTNNKKQISMYFYSVFITLIFVFVFF